MGIRHTSWATILLLTMIGCGSSDGPQLATVSGRVTLNGEPLPNATVMFLPEQGRPSVTTTGSDGRYTLEYTKDAPGAKVGTHTVKITTKRTDNRGRITTPEKVPPRYNTETTLTRKVKPGDNTINFELASQ